ncbi:protoporphyrinogen oxidase [Zavarzinella formosa]|uniref:protoporphyrinogen oxidase n=1 Tax=Zavarzinella formosa TaxID=360055 RepID=UPI0002FCC40E|nr:protoporphyrinogen oxidase [Zavarzinella formosa]
MKQPLPRIAIVGGGLAGLAVAFRIEQLLPMAHLTILEKKPAPGGNIASPLIDGYRVETGPNGFLDAKPSTMNLCRELGIADELIAASEGSRKNRYLCIGGKLVALPGSLGAFIRSPLLGWRGKFNVLWEKYRRPNPPEEEESIADFARRRAGSEVADVLADAFVTGIHAGDPKLLSVDAAFPRLKQFERDFGSVSRGFRNASRLRRAAAKAEGREPQPVKMWSFRNGLGRLIDRFAEVLSDSLKLNSPVHRVRQMLDGTWQLLLDDDQVLSADAVVMTSPAHAQAKQLRELDATLADELAGIPHNKIAVVALGYRQKDAGKHSLDGFGFITPQSTRRDVLGVQWCSSIFPGRAPEGHVLWRALCGGWNRPDILEWDDARLTEAVHRELQQVMGVANFPAFRHIIRWENAIPQYHVGHLARVARIDREAAKWPGLFLGGNAFRGVAINDQTEDAERIAAAVAGYIGNSFSPSGICPLPFGDGAV